MSQSHPSRKTIALYAGTVALVIFGIASWSLSFRLAWVQTQHTQQTGLWRPPSLPARPVKLHLRVEGQGIAAEALGRELARRLAELGGLEVVLLEGDPGPDQHPFVVASIRETSGFWTPFHSQKSAVVELKYASGTSRIGPAWSVSPEDPIRESQSLWLQARSDVELGATGIVSRPFVYEALVEAPVAGFVKRLAQALVPESGPAK